MKKILLLFFACLLAASFSLRAQEDERTQPKGLLIENQAGPEISAYKQEKLLLDLGATELANWKKISWKMTSQGISTGSYGGGQSVVLESPAIQLPALTNDRGRLNLYVKEWFEIESYHDKGVVQVSEDNGRSWQTLSIRDGKGDWRTSLVGLTEYAGKSIKIAFRLIADKSHHYRGWQIEKLTLKQEVLEKRAFAPLVMPVEKTKASGAARSDVGLMSTLTGQLVGAVDAQRFPRYIFTHLTVSQGGTPLLNLDKSNFFVREYVRDGLGNLDTLSVPKDDNFLVYSPTADTILKPVDIVFLMDNSGSMGDEQAAVAANVANFVGQLDASGYDYRLGLCRFGQSTSSGIPLFHDNARFYTDHNEFVTVWNAVNNTSGSREPSWDALHQSSVQYSFRAGAQKIFILITDESITGNNINYNIIKDRQVVIDQLNNAGVRTYTLVPAGAVFDSDFGAIATATQGRSYNILSPFNDILQDIGTEIRGTYTIRYAPTNPVFDGLLRDVEIKVNYGGQELTLLGHYTPGAAPIILRTNHTLALHRQAQINGVAVRIEVEAIDWDNFHTNSVSLYYRRASTTTSYVQATMAMTSITVGDPSQGIPTRSIWEATIPAGSVLDPGIQYYIRASDGQATTITPEFIDREGYPYSFAVLPNLPPVLNHTPLETADPKNPIVFTAEAIDNTLQINKVYLYYAKESDNAYTIVEMQNVAGTNNYQFTLPALNVNTLLNYYIVAIDNFNVSVFSGSDVSPHSIAVGVPWGVPSSPTFHTIRFFSSGTYPATVTIDNVAPAAGDVIGVFYTDGNGVLKPGGSMTWPAASLVAYGDNPVTTHKDGFVTGEPFTFRIFRKSDGSIFDTEHIIYSIGISQQTFQASKQSFIKELRAFSEQVIQLKQGLNLSSTFLSPRSAAFSDILSPIASSVQNVEDSYGNTYVPAGGSNTLTTHSNGYGYRIFMNSAALLRVKGSKLNPTTVTVTLSSQEQGVIVGCPYTAPEDVEAVFQRFDPNIYIVDRYVTDDNGNVLVETYSPAWDINTWTDKNLEPGKGYRVYVFGDQPFTFPAASGPYAGLAAGARTASSPAISHTAQPVKSISDYMHVLIPSGAWSNAPAEKSELRVYNKKGKLLGKSSVGSDGTAIIIDGTLIKNQEPFYLRLWDEGSRTERPLLVSTWEYGNSTYQNLKTSVIGKLQEKNVTSEEAALAVFPNPVVSEGEIHFTLEDDTEVTIELYDAQNTRVQRTLVAREYYSKGSHEVTFNKQGLPAGLYLVRITKGKAFETKRMVVK